MTLGRAPRAHVLRRDRKAASSTALSDDRPSLRDNVSTEARITGYTPETLSRAATAIGCRLYADLVPLKNRGSKRLKDVNDFAYAA